MPIEDYAEFVKQAKRGEILIGVEPAVARRFFTDTDSSFVKEKIGESLTMERFFVKSVWLLDYVSLLAGLIFCVLALKWYSVIAIPIMLLSWFFLSSQASGARQTIGGAFLLVAFCFLLTFGLRSRGTMMIIWLILLPLPYFFVRLTYLFATIFLRTLVVRNEHAFHLLYGKGVFLKEAQEQER